MVLKVFKQLNLSPTEISLGDETGDVDRAKRPWEIVPAGHRIGTPEPLFKELVRFCYNYLLLPLLFPSHIVCSVFSLCLISMMGNKN